jgi:hypothetical protein
MKNKISKLIIMGTYHRLVDKSQPRSNTGKEIAREFCVSHDFHLQQVDLVNERGIGRIANIHPKPLSRPALGSTLMGSEGGDHLSNYGPSYKHSGDMRAGCTFRTSCTQGRSVESLGSILR